MFTTCEEIVEYVGDFLTTGVLWMLGLFGVNLTFGRKQEPASKGNEMFFKKLSFMKREQNLITTG